MIDLKITEETLSIQSCINSVASSQSGGINLFIGQVRAQTAGRKVVALQFEAYETMALNEMKMIAVTVYEKWTIHKISIHHRIGTLRVGDIPVIIAVSASHRAEAFEACRYIIDTLKAKVPIWKKEIFEDGEVWVAAHP